LKGEPVFASALSFRLEEKNSDSHSFILSGIRSFVFSATVPPKPPKGLLRAAKINEKATIAKADTPTASTAFSGLGTHTCCKRSGLDDDGFVV
jgi:hypothetical protein